MFWMFHVFSKLASKELDVLGDVGLSYAPNWCTHLVGSG